MNDSIAICFTADFKYLYKNINRILKQLKDQGNYFGDIVIITNLFTPTFLLGIRNKKNNIYILRFKKIRFSKSANYMLNNLDVKFNRHKNKRFQWQKLYLFHTRLKKWKYVFYLDINMNIHYDINKLLSIKPENVLFARADGYPDYKWKLKSQFDSSSKLYEKLRSSYNLEISNYFQTGLLYFDTKIIEKKTLVDLINLVEKYPISVTNEQGIMNLYFIFIKKLYVELTNYVDSKISYYYWKLPDQEIIITKSINEKFK